MPTVIAYTTSPADHTNEWVVEVDGVRRGRYMGHDAPFHAARCANQWRRELGLIPQLRTKDD